jgi:hypothetical protein
VAVEHDARDERPGSRSESEDPYVSVRLGAGYLRMTAAVAARLRDTVEETAGGAEWLAGPMSQALSLLALGARSPVNDDDVARVAERIPGLTPSRAAHLLDRWQRAAAGMIQKCHDSETGHGRQRRETTKNQQLSEDRSATCREALQFFRFSVLVAFSQRSWHPNGM